LIPLSIERRRLKRDPQAKHYRDQALTPVDDQELASMEMYTQLMPDFRRFIRR
jgi:hypothetical protein